MKKHFHKIILLAGCGLVLLGSCKKDETKVTYNGGTAPVLTSSVTDSIPLPVTDTTGNAVTFSWTNPNYTFSDGISSLNVTYYLQFDTVGANFTSPSMQTVGISSDLTTTLTVSQLNNIVSNGMLLATGAPHNLQVRVQSFIQPYTSGSTPQGALNSESLNFSVVPYAPPPVVSPPSSGQLWLVGGDSKIGAWANPVPPAQQFTQLTPLHYQITIALSGGDPTNGDDEFLILPVNGSWSNKYASSLLPTSSTSAGGTFGYNLAQNFAGPAAAGTYLIDVNFQTGKYTLTKQ